MLHSYLVDTTEWGDVDGLTTDGTTATDTSRVLTWAGVDDGADEDLKWVLGSESTNEDAGRSQSNVETGKDWAIPISKQLNQLQHTSQLKRFDCIFTHTQTQLRFIYQVRYIPSQ